MKNASGFLIMSSIEIKRYLYAYKRIAASVFAALLTGAALLAGVNEFEKRGGLFEPFTIGVVDNDGAAELRFVFDFFNEAVIDLEYMDSAEAHRKLIQGELPAYVELPENFTSDVFYGRNAPFTAHINKSFPLQSGVVLLLSNGGIGYLSASQAGIYSTMDEAAALGMSRAEIQSRLLYPVNIAFATRLLEFRNLFDHEVLPLTSDFSEAETARNSKEVSVTEYYAKRFAVFWYILNILVFIPIIQGYTSDAYARFKLAGVSAYIVHAVRLSGFFAVQLLLALPLAFYFGIITTVALVFFLSSFALFSAAVFRTREHHTAACGLFIFFSALSQWLASGGVIPFAFLPRELLFIQKYSVISWAADAKFISIFILALICYGMVVAVEFFSGSSARKI